MHVSLLLGQCAVIVVITHLTYHPIRAAPKAEKPTSHQVTYHSISMFVMMLLRAIRCNADRTDSCSLGTSSALTRAASPT
jgi:hypothetical protein